MASELLSQGNLPDPVRLQVAARIRRACNAITYLTVDLLEYTRSRLGSGIPVELADCDVAALCDNAMDAMRGSFPERTFVQRSEGALRTRCDSNRLAQVLWNLLDNAVHHGDPARPVELEVKERHDAVVLKVASFGDVIPPESLHSIFEPMVRLVPARPEATQRLGSSLGLGLFIVREIVKGHGGSVTVTSDADRGTVFTVELPKPTL